MLELFGGCGARTVQLATLFEHVTVVEGDPLLSGQLGSAAGGGGGGGGLRLEQQQPRKRA